VQLNNDEYIAKTECIKSSENLKAKMKIEIGKLENKAMCTK
jgi:hypothetical protein